MERVTVRSVQHERRLSDAADEKKRRSSSPLHPSKEKK
jgi:hypothetical protein